MSTEAVRLRLYALLSAMEHDLRELLRNSILTQKPIENVFSEDIIAKLVDRRKREADSDNKSQDLIDYTDLGDAIDAVRKEANLLGSDALRHFKTYHSKLQSLIPIRNRVMHSRPLLLDDMPNSASYCKEIAKSRPDMWPNLRSTIHSLETDKNYLLRIEFKPDSTQNSSILNNLPLPDFDDTGFIGRTDESKKIMQAITGAYPVVTVTGEGGLGKTAVALKVCYDLLDSEDCQFDAIIWTSAKTTRLTSREIQNIDDAITTSLGLFELAADQIDAQGGGDPLARLISQLETFRILLVIDNLETILDENITKLVQNLPTGSKILFTTKKSIGAYDFPIPLHPFSDDEAGYYLRAIARFWGKQAISGATAAQVETYCKKLQRNPLFIKWFVQAVSEGQSPQRVLANPKIVLKFCLSSVFENLTDSSKRILQTLAFDSRGATESLIIYFTDLEPSDVQSGLIELMASNLVRMIANKGDSEDALFYPSEMALFYIRNYHDGEGINEVELVKKKRALTAAREEFSATHGVDPYDFNNISVRNDGDLIAAKLLRDAMRATKNSNIPVARSKAEQAEGINPGYFEVHRVFAIIFQTDDMLMRADERFQSAISLAPDVPSLRLWYGDFLFKRMDDPSSALAQYKIGLRVEPKSIPLLASAGRLKMAEKEFERADKYISEAEDVTTKNTKLRRRVLDLRFQYFARSIEKYVSDGAMHDAHQRLSELYDKANEVDGALIDEKMLQKVRRVTSSVEHLQSFFQNGQEAESVAKLVGWFKAFFSGSAVHGDSHDRWAGVSSDAELEGELRSLHGGYGFIDAERGSIFFHFSEWKDSVPPSDVPLGESVCFRLGENTRGPVAIKVHRKEREKAPAGWLLQLRGYLSAVNPTYGFITGNDGNTYFLSYSDFLDPNISKEILKGAQVEFDVSPEKKGRYPSAKFVKII